MENDKDLLRERRIMLGRHAKDVLENVAFQQALEDILQDLFARFLATPAQDASERERIWAVGQQAGQVTNRLQAMIETGKLEDSNKAADRNR